MAKPEAPCQGCRKRTATCHATCEAYIRFQKENEAYRALRIAELDKSRPAPAFWKYVDKAIKAKRRDKR